MERGRLVIKNRYIQCVCKTPCGQEITEMFRIGTCPCVSCGGADLNCKICKGTDKIIFIVKPKGGY